MTNGKLRFKTHIFSGLVIHVRIVKSIYKIFTEKRRRKKNTFRMTAYYKCHDYIGHEMEYAIQLGSNETQQNKKYYI